MNIAYLIGGRGVGKTTTGRTLGIYHGFKFVDLDEEICAIMGMDVAKIVASCGWNGFREHEGRILEKITMECRGFAGWSVIACGGGIIEQEGNIDYMRKNGLVIWLDTPLATQLARLAKEEERRQRPSLTGNDMLEELPGIMERRKILYSRAAHARLDSSQEQNALCSQIASLCKANK